MPYTTSLFSGHPPSDTGVIPPLNPLLDPPSPYSCYSSGDINPFNLLLDPPSPHSKTIASLYDQQEEDLCEIIAVLIADQIICSTMLRWVLWVKNRSQSFTNITAFWNDLERKRNFRVNRTTFQHLCTELSGKLQHASTVRAAVSAETRVAIALWQLATNVEYRTIYHLFGVGFRQLVSSFMKYAGQ